MQNVILNLKSPQAIQTDIAFTQGDYGEAKLTIAVKDNEQYITGDTGASISFLRADGNIVTGELSGTQGMYGYTFAGNELETSGKTVATVTIKYTGGRVSTAAFIFTVRYNPAYDKKIPAGPYITELEKIKNQAQSYVEYLSTLIEQLQPDIGSAALTKADLVNGYTQTVEGIKAFDAAAAKSLKELVDGKIDITKIVNNFLSTDASMVLSAALGPIIDQRLTDLLNKYNQLNGDFEILAIADIDFVVWAKSRVKDKKPVFFMMSRMTNTIFKSNFGVGIMFYNRTFTNTTAYFIFASSAGVEYKDMAL